MADFERASGVKVHTESSLDQLTSRGVRGTLTDASVFYRINDSTFSLGVTNLFDRRYYPTANGDDNISPGTPRAVQLSLRHTF